MSNNINALLNAAVGATNHFLPAASGTTGTHAAAVQGNAAAASGAAAHGAASVAAGNVRAAAGSGTTAGQWPATMFPVGIAPGNTGTQPVFGAVNGAGQSVVQRGPRIWDGSILCRTDSTTDVIEQKANGVFYSARMHGSVDKPFAYHFAPPSPFVDPTTRRVKNSIAFPSTQPVSGAGQPAFPPGLGLSNHAAPTQSVPAPLPAVGPTQSLPTPGNSSVPFPSAQPSVSPGPLVSSDAALHRADSTADWVKQQANSHYSSAHMEDNVEQPSAQHSPPPSPFVQPAQSLPVFPSVFTSTRRPPAVDIPETLPLPPIVIPADIFSVTVPDSPAAAAATSEARKRAYRSINGRAATARRGLDWKGPGMRYNRPHAHHITPDDCQNLRRFDAHRTRGDRKLIEAEALGVWNKNNQLHFLQKLREQELAKPPHLRDNFVTGAEVDMGLQIDRVRETRQIAAAQVAFIAKDFFPETPPVPAPRPSPPPPPRSIWSVVAGAVTGLLKRKRDSEDEPAPPSAKRSRVEQKPEPQPRFVFLRTMEVETPPRPQRGAIAETHPDSLPYNGAAAYAVQYSTSDFAMQTDEDSVSRAAAGPSRKPPSRMPSMTNAGAAGPSRQPTKAPLKHTPFVVAPGAYLSTVSPPRPGPAPKGKDRRVEFKPCVTVARPRRFTSPPPPHMVGTEDDDEDDEDEAQQPVDAEVPRDVRDVLSGALLTPEALAALGLDSAGGGDPTVRHLWSHPNAKYANYKDATIQCDLVGQKRRRGTRAGRKVQERRALKEAATATKGDEKMDDGA